MRHHLGVDPVLGDGVPGRPCAEVGGYALVHDLRVDVFVVDDEQTVVTATIERQ